MSTTTINEQNQRFLAAAMAGEPVPEYAWLTAPNVPPLPESPEVVHRRELEAAIEAKCESMLGWARGDLNLGRPVNTSAVEAKVKQLRADLDVAGRYSNDVTRMPAFIEYAASLRFIKRAPGLRPTQLKGDFRKTVKENA